MSSLNYAATSAAQTRRDSGENAGLLLRSTDLPRIGPDTGTIIMESMFCHFILFMCLCIAQNSQNLTLGK